MKKLNSRQVKDLEEFVNSVSHEGFAYACSNYPIKDKELKAAICDPVKKAELLLEKYMEQNDLIYS